MEFDTTFSKSFVAYLATLLSWASGNPIGFYWGGAQFGDTSYHE
jgi:hypothetical protein